MIASAAMVIGPTAVVLIAFVVDERVSRKAKRQRARAAWEMAWSRPRGVPAQ